MKSFALHFGLEGFRFSHLQATMNLSSHGVQVPVVGAREQRPLYAAGQSFQLLVVSGKHGNTLVRALGCPSGASISSSRCHSRPSAISAPSVGANSDLGSAHRGR